MEKTLPIGLRNNNPGNIRNSNTKFKGQLPSDNAFKKFDTIVNGYRAIFVLLRNYNRIYGIDTISGIINRYAPSIENDTRKYVEFVSAVSNIPPDAKIDFNMKMPLISIVYAISHMENGVIPNLHEIIDGYYASIC